jgi:hypothetical protein
MPRKPHKHGGAVHARGISNLKVCVICGANDAGDELCRVADVFCQAEVNGNITRN